MSARLILLSDLWGLDQAAWMSFYIQQLQPYFDLMVYDSCSLADVPSELTTEQAVHQHFVHIGIDRAVEKLIQLEPQKTVILAFSIGGTIAWKAIEKGLKSSFFYAISATRLRYQTTSLQSPINVFFGQQDPYKPSTSWFNKMNISPFIIPDGEHTLYRSPIFAQTICQQIIQNQQTIIHP